MGGSTKFLIYVKWGGHNKVEKFGRKMTKNSQNMHENEESRQEVWVTRTHFLKILKMGGSL